MTYSSIVADSSFFICFIDDIKQSVELVKILKCQRLVFIAGTVVISEIKESFSRAKLSTLLENKIQKFHFHELGEILRAFFSEEEINKGETEVIAISYILAFQKKNFQFIVDDRGGRKYVEHNFQELIPKMIGTIGFISVCCCDYDIFAKDEATTIINMIDNSKFRAPKQTIKDAIERIKVCENVQFEY